ncbi:nucleoside-diphosphate-sugar epimerase [Arcticibacter tournemirensis]|uniref:NAD(P)-dependent oxidoreductase n=1 Tax=Arcticibacter tournemirensis TaxID=699437 RepID=A0A5M9HKJ5_9SPHI|nr:NAD(P)-dependent oxidoreductase [Arcticibacter tournemirensis]KAA8486793.1 NAD(P)-dependent oxidoreductase [Arcticibacter tournemirensis]TQM49337.1 nucleoside-diphosphate-sugar epimerase [Arcticibacter tournemirensis]
MLKVLITGGSGFIGTNLIESLISDNVQILNVDKVKPVIDSHVSYWRRTDILDHKNLEEIITQFNPEVIVHLAAVTDLDGKTLSYYRTNFEGTKNVIDIAAKLPALRKVIYTSSMYVCRPGLIPSDYDTYKPHTLYGESKVKGELLVKAIKDATYNWIIIRPTSIWGPWFKIPYIDFFDVVYKGRYVNFGKTCTKTYGYIGNTVFQLRKLISAEGVHKRTFYLGDRPAIPISDWANEISLEMGKGKIKSVPFALIKCAAIAGDILGGLKIKFPMTSFRLANMKTNNVLPLDDIYQVVDELPFTRLEGVRNTLKWLKSHRGYNIKMKDMSDLRGDNVPSVNGFSGETETTVRAVVQ